MRLQPFVIVKLIVILFAQLQVKRSSKTIIIIIIIIIEQSVDMLHECVRIREGSADVT